MSQLLTNQPTNGRKGKMYARNMVFYALLKYVVLICLQHIRFAGPRVFQEIGQLRLPFGIVEVQGTADNFSKEQDQT